MGYQRDEDVRQWCQIHGIRFHEYPTNGIIRRLDDRDSWAHLRNQHGCSTDAKTG